MTNCNFINNTADNILELRYINSYLDNSRFFNNTARSRLVNARYEGDLVSNCEFINNNLTSSGDCLLYVSGDNSTVKNCKFEDNYIEYEEGSPKPIIQVSYIPWGYDPADEDVPYDYENISISNCSFKGNSGIPIVWNAKSGNVTGCTFTDNLGNILIHGNVSLDNEAYYFTVNAYNDTIFGYNGDDVSNTLLDIKYLGQKSGKIAIYLNGVECYNKEINSKFTSIDVNSLDKVRCGLVDMLVKFIIGGSKYEIYNGKVFIDYAIGVDGFYDNIYLVPHVAQEINITLPKGATGTLTLNDGIKNHVLKIVNGKSTYSFMTSNHTLGEHKLTLSLTGDPIYPNKTIEFTFYATYNSIYSNVAAIGEDDYITLDFPDNFNQNITVYYGTSYDGRELVSVMNGVSGIVKIPFTGLNLGQNYYVLNISSFSYERTFFVYGIENCPGFSSSIDSSTIEYGSDAIVAIVSPMPDCKLVLEIDGNYRYADLNNTTLTQHVSGLSVGEHRIKLYVYNSTYGYSYSNHFIVTVKAKPVPAKIVAKDYSAYYNKGTYSVTVYGTDGKVAKNANVVFKINGKKVATVKTDSKGVAKVKIPTKYVPKTYKISATALGKTVTKKLVVKQVLTLKKVAVKKSAKKLVITASLKEGKKAIKGKKITFKFNGKKYTAKTNSKGIAKITIKSAVLKKLKVGKKLAYQATYIKDTVKRTVKVKK